MSYTVATHVKELLAKLNMRCGGDFVEALDKCVEDLVKKAAARAKENKRQTVYGCDC
jgi:histone H3/H4